MIKPRLAGLGAAGAGVGAGAAAAGAADCAWPEGAGACAASAGRLAKSDNTASDFIIGILHDRLIDEGSGHGAWAGRSKNEGTAAAVVVTGPYVTVSSFCPLACSASLATN